MKVRFGRRKSGMNSGRLRLSRSATSLYSTLPASGITMWSTISRLRNESASQSIPVGGAATAGNVGRSADGTQVGGSCDPSFQPRGRAVRHPERLGNLGRVGPCRLEAELATNLPHEGASDPRRRSEQKKTRCLQRVP